MGMSIDSAPIAFNFKAMQDAQAAL